MKFTLNIMFSIYPSAIWAFHAHVFHYDRISTQLRRNCDPTVTHNCEKLQRSYA